jgi:DNA (cytosine-5)-methyltransferase 1
MRIPTNRPKFIDIFAGCGGLSLGLMAAGWEGIFAIEKSPMAFETLKHNLIGHKDKYSYSWPNWLPIKELEIQFVLDHYRENILQLSNLDLLAGGPPCQGYSIAGERRIDDERNYLFNQYLEFVKLVNPKILLLENVSTFATPFTKTERGSNGQKVENTFNASDDLQNKLIALNYQPFVACPVFAKNFGVPQLRPRYILIAIRKDLQVNNATLNPVEILESNRKDFLKNKGLPVNEEVTLSQAISDLLKSHGVTTCLEAGMGKFQQGKYGHAIGPYQILMRKRRNGMAIKDGEVADSHRFPNHRQQTIDRFLQIITNYRPGIQLRIDELEALGTHKHRVAPLASNESCHTLTSLPDDLVHYCEPRIPTVREYARIQSFPDWFQFKSKYTTGGDRRKVEVPRYTQVANAVPPLLANALGETLQVVLKKLVSEPKETAIIVDQQAFLISPLV